MKDWASMLAVLAVLSASLALAEDFRTIRGKEYKDATVSRVEPDGIVLRTKSGIVKLYFSELREDAQERFRHNASKTPVAASPYQSPANTGTPAKIPAAIEKLQRRGLLRLECSDPDAKAWIAPAAWRMWGAQEKENVTKNLAVYCHPQYPSIWILDQHSGRKLASYDSFRRFKAY